MSKALVIVALAAIAVAITMRQGGVPMQAASHIGHVRHVVLFKFKPGTPAEKVAEIEKAFGQLPKQIPTIIDYEWGTNISPEDHAKGYTHCFLVTFADEAGRDAYLPHPAHKKFVEVLGPHLEEAHVIDYIAKP